LKLFYFLGEKIYSLVIKKKGEYFIKKQPGIDMKNLYPGKNAEKKLRDYYIKKIAYILCIFCIGILFTIFTFAKGYMENVIIEGKYIARNSYGKGEKQVNLTVGYEDGSKEEIVLNIEERHYTDKELEELYEQAKSEVYKLIFSDGIKPDEVRENLHLPDYLEGFPFQIQWESENYALVDYDGTVYNSELPEKGEIVNLHVVFQCYEFKREYVFPVHILPPFLSEEEMRRQELRKRIEENEQKSIYEETYILPEEINGEAVGWKEAKEDNVGIVLLLVCAAAILVYYMKDYDLHKQVLLKREEMFACYPEIVNRLVLYVGAGMTVRNAWRKIALDNAKKKTKRGRKGYIYQEMLFACYEMDSGTSEGEAYEHFGKRCGIEQYIKLATLLVQNMQKGNSTMLLQLKEEAETAFVQRMDQARKKGEEAGTKLLMPMMILFGMVLILIMIPAFGTFGM